MTDPCPTRKPLASAGPVGLSTVAFSISFFWPLSTGRVDAVCASAVIPVGTGAALVQTIN